MFLNSFPTSEHIFPILPLSLSKKIQKNFHVTKFFTLCFPSTLTIFSMSPCKISSQNTKLQRTTHAAPWHAQLQPNVQRDFAHGQQIAASSAATRSTPWAANVPTSKIFRQTTSKPQSNTT